MSDNVFCCKDMQRNLEHVCSEHGTNIWDCADHLICYSSCFDEFGIIIHDGGNSYVQISFCPFCGQKLPISKRSKFFEILEELGLEWDSDNLPSEFETDEWWKKRGL